MTQSELAKRSGLSQPTISDLERDGTNDVGAATVLRVAAALETNTTWLMTDRGDPDEILPTGDAADLLALYAQLSPDNQRAILAAAAALRNSQEPSRLGHK